MANKAFAADRKKPRPMKSGVILSKQKTMSANKELYRLATFWWALCAPLAISVMLALYIIWANHLVFEPTYKGLNNLLDIFKVPLGISALIFPSIALVATNHRSKQSAEQIILQTSQNIFSNYYNHVEQFEKYCNQINEFSNPAYNGFILKNNSRIFHDVFYPNSKIGKYDIDINFVNFVLVLHVNAKNKVNDIINYLVKIDENSKENFNINEDVELKFMLLDYRRISDIFLHKFRELKILNSDEISSIINLNEACHICTNVFNNILKFDPSVDIELSTDEFVSLGKEYSKFKMFYEYKFDGIDFT